MKTKPENIKKPLKNLKKKHLIHLYFYTDSIAFPRHQETTLADTFPFKLKDKLEINKNFKVLLCLRGLGGATIGELKKIFIRDLGYFSPFPRKKESSIIILNIGIVDAAPVPFTYPLRYISKIPLIGSKISKIILTPLVKNRPILQKIWSFRRTSPHMFKYNIRKMVRLAKDRGFDVISLETPRPPFYLEKRSPGLRDSIATYNSIKRNVPGLIHLKPMNLKKTHFLSDGHHLTKNGHRLVAGQLARAIAQRQKSRSLDSGLKNS